MPAKIRSDQLARLKLAAIYFSGYGVTPQNGIKPWCVGHQLLLHGKRVRLRERVELEAQAVRRLVKGVTPMTWPSRQHQT